MKNLLLSFNELTLVQLYDLMALRQEVFVVEQDCPYQDADGKDQIAYHFLMYQKDLLAAYTRILPAGTSYEKYASIGRVVNSPKVRGKGIGKTLMEESIKHCQLLYPETPIKISAQVYLLKFYTDLGFNETGDRYLEDGIPHTAMIFES